jgi:hypothetical protein
MSLLGKLGTMMNSQVGLLVIFILFIATLMLGVFASRSFLKKEYRGQFAVLVALIYISIVFFIMTFGFRKSGLVSAAAVPRLWILGILSCCTYLLVIMLNGTESPDPSTSSFAKPIQYILLALVYVVLIPYLGFFIASLAFLIIGIVILAYRRWTVIIGVALGWLAFSYFLFYKLLFVPLPEGLLISLLRG